MTYPHLRAFGLAGALLPSVASAGPPPSAPSIHITVNGSVDKLCSIGPVGQSTLNVGEMINPTTGELASIRNPPSTSISGSWCNTASTIKVVATPLVAESFSFSAPPAGFTKTVNYTASVGWTTATTPASFTTNGDEAGLQPTAAAGIENEASPSAADIKVTIGNFASPSLGDFLVADPNYSGTITITLTPSP